MNVYRGIIIRADFRLTSQNPGEGHSVTETIADRALCSVAMPNIKSPAIVQRISRHLRIDIQKAEDLFYDTQRFLWMASQSAGACIPSPLIDDAWHEFILFTRNYDDFCRRYCGGFMHHEPHSGEEVGPVDVAILRPTIDLMHKVFGDTVAMEKQIAGQRQQEERYTKAYGAGLFSMEQLKGYTLPIRETISSLELQISKARQEAREVGTDVLPSEKDMDVFAKEAQKTHKDLNFEEKRAIVLNTVEKIIGTQKELKVSGFIPVTNTYGGFKTKDRNCWFAECGEVYAV